MNKERKAWFSFVLVIENFVITFGNKETNNYETLLTNLLSAFYDLGCNMSVEPYFLYSHLDGVLDNLGTISDEQGEQFYQDLKTMEEHYQGR